MNLTSLRRFPHCITFFLMLRQAYPSFFYKKLSFTYFDLLLNVNYLHHGPRCVISRSHGSEVFTILTFSRDWSERSVGRV